MMQFKKASLTVGERVTGKRRAGNKNEAGAQVGCYCRVQVRDDGAWMSRDTAQEKKRGD